MDPDKHHQDPLYRQLSVHMLFSEICKSEGCASRLNINDKLTPEELTAYNLANLCPDCVEDLNEDFQDWIQIHKFIIERKFLGLDSYKFGSEHLFGQLKRLNRLRGTMTA